MSETHNNIAYHTLPNGLRMVYRHAQSGVEYCGIAVGVGSRDEAPGYYGLAHFVEHTIFKGTDKRRSSHIINRMETVGGELNAYTTKEETMIYSVFPKGNLSRAVELIADLVTNSRFPAIELDKEREVVADEINSYLDSPSEAIFDDFDDLIFAGSQLGHNILGTEDSLATFTSEVCRDYLRRHYIPSNMVFFYMGATSVDTVIKNVTRYLGSMSSSHYSPNRVAPVVAPAFDITRKIDSHQSHTVIGARLPGMYSPLRYPLALLVNMLGGPGMNSLLNVALRERRGLVYTVDASLSMFTDVGAMMIYFGCDPADAKRCRRLVYNQLDRLASTTLSDKAVNAAKRQYLGQLAVASENREQVALSIGRSMLYHGKVFSNSETEELINAITPQQLNEAARLIAPSTLSTLTLS